MKYLSHFEVGLKIEADPYNGLTTHSINVQFVTHSSLSRMTFPAVLVFNRVFEIRDHIRRRHHHRYRSLLSFSIPDMNESSRQDQGG